MAAPAAADKHADQKTEHRKRTDIYTKRQHAESLISILINGIPPNGIKPENRVYKLAFRDGRYENVTETAEYKTVYRYNGICIRIIIMSAGRTRRNEELNMSCNMKERNYLSARWSHVK